METLVQVALFAVTLSTGERAAVAQIDIEDGWHIYWENPGQSGYPTELEGDCVLKTVYAPPHRFMMPGDILNYGYEGTVRLFGSGHCLPGDEVTLSWLSCREDTCIPGEYHGSLQELPADRISAVEEEWALNARAKAISRTDTGWVIALKTGRHSTIEYFPTAQIEAQGPEPVVAAGFWRQKWTLKGEMPIAQSEKVVVRLQNRGKEEILIYTAEE